MARSMTGFGSDEASSNGITVYTEIKSLNSRYTDISLHLPDMMRERELELKEVIQSYIERGKIHLNTQIDTSGTGTPDITFNEERLKGYVNLLRQMKEAGGLQHPVTLDHLLQFEDLFESREEDEEVKQTVWKLLVQTSRAAMEQLNQMRSQEGQQLEKDLRQRVEYMQEIMESVKEKAEQRAPEARQTLRERIQKLVDDESFDEERLEMEVAVLADKVDVTEEIVRLQSHFKYFMEALDQTGAIGRRLNFLSQEMNREINTIGSKANSSEISKQVIEVKQTLEKIKEQIHNIE